MKKNIFLAIALLSVVGGMNGMKKIIPASNISSIPKKLWAFRLWNDNAFLQKLLIYCSADFKNAYKAGNIGCKEFGDNYVVYIGKSAFGPVTKCALIDKKTGNVKELVGDAAQKVVFGEPSYFTKAKEFLFGSNNGQAAKQEQEQQQVVRQVFEPKKRIMLTATNKINGNSIENYCINLEGTEEQFEALRDAEQPSYLSSFGSFLWGNKGKIGFAAYALLCIINFRNSK